MTKCLYLYNDTLYTTYFLDTIKNFFTKPSYDNMEQIQSLMRKVSKSFGSLQYITKRSRSMENIHTDTYIHTYVQIYIQSPAGSNTEHG